MHPRKQQTFSKEVAQYIVSSMGQQDKMLHLLYVVYFQEYPFITFHEFLVMILQALSYLKEKK